MRASSAPTALGPLREVLNRYVDTGIGSGIVAVIARGSDVHVESAGTLAFEGAGTKTPMGGDTVFHAASWTKTVVAACAMTLVEEGKLRLTDPVDVFLPELANMSVLVDPCGPLDQTVPAKRPVTLVDLLTCRLGTGTVLAEPGTVPISDALSALERPHDDSNSGTSADEYLRGLGALPLVYQPGERWMYYTPAIVLGVLVERAAGKPLGVALRERIFEPLGMMDSTLEVRADQVSRLATPYRVDLDTGSRVAEGGPERVGLHRPPFKQASSGLFTTANDYVQFTSTLLAGGIHGGSRLFSARTVSLMTTDHLTERQKATSTFVWPPGFYGGFGWGYALGVVTRGRRLGPSVGSYGWYGKYGTVWFNDPEAKLTTMLVCQSDTGWKPVRVFREFWALAYGAEDR